MDDIPVLYIRKMTLHAAPNISTGVNLLAINFKFFQLRIEILFLRMANLEHYSFSALLWNGIFKLIY